MHAGSVRTFDPQTRCALSDGSQCMLNLHELPTGREDCQGIARFADEIGMRLNQLIFTCMLRRLRWPLINMWGYVERDDVLHKDGRASVVSWNMFVPVVQPSRRGS
jgi:hypothetical protein